MLQFFSTFTVRTFSGSPVESITSFEFRVTKMEFWQAAASGSALLPAAACPNANSHQFS